MCPEIRGRGGCVDGEDNAARRQVHAFRRYQHRDRHLGLMFLGITFLVLVGGNRSELDGAELTGSEEEKQEYCTRHHGPLSVFDTLLNRCVCRRGSQSDGAHLRCISDQEALKRKAVDSDTPRGGQGQGGGLSPHRTPQTKVAEQKQTIKLVGDSPTRTSTDLIEYCNDTRSWLMRHMPKTVIKILRWVLRMKSMSPYEECMEKWAEMERNQTVWENAQYDILILEQKHLFNSFQRFVYMEEQLQAEIGHEAHNRETLLESFGRRIDETKKNATILAKEKEKIEKRIIAALFRGDKGDDKSREISARELKELEEANEKLKFALREKETAAHKTDKQVESFQAQLEEEERQFKALARELEDMRKLAKKVGKGKIAVDYDAECRKKFGHAYYVGNKGCKCLEGYTMRNKKCLAKQRAETYTSPGDKTCQSRDADGKCVATGYLGDKGGQRTVAKITEKKGIGGRESHLW